MMYKCLLVWTGYLWWLSHPLEGRGRRNPGLGIKAHPQWSSRSLVWGSDPPGGDPPSTAWPQEACLVSSAMCPFCSFRLSSSPHTQLHAHYMSNTLFPEYVSLTYSPSSSSFSDARQTSTCLPSPKSYLLFREAFPDYTKSCLALLYSCRTVHTALS